MDTVWQPREEPPVDPVETLIRAARRLLPGIQRETQEGKGAVARGFTLDLGEWGERAEVALSATIGARANFASRSVVAYLFNGSLTGIGQPRRFGGEALIDLETGAVLAMEFDMVPPARA
jgi:hypothetical protein